MLEKIHLRCYECNHEFVKDVDTKDKIFEIVCPKCNKQKIEIDLGKGTLGLNNYRG